LKKKIAKKKQLLRGGTTKQTKPGKLISRTGKIRERGTYLKADSKRRKTSEKCEGGRIRDDVQ